RPQSAHVRIIGSADPGVGCVVAVLIAVDFFPIAQRVRAQRVGDARNIETMESCRQEARPADRQRRFQKITTIHEFPPHQSPPSPPGAGGGGGGGGSSPPHHPPPPHPPPREKGGGGTSLNQFPVHPKGIRVSALPFPPPIRPKRRNRLKASRP